MAPSLSDERPSKACDAVKSTLATDSPETGLADFEAVAGRFRVLVSFRLVNVGVELFAFYFEKVAEQNKRRIVRVPRVGGLRDSRTSRWLAFGHCESGASDAAETRPNDLRIVFALGNFDFFGRCQFGQLDLVVRGRQDRHVDDFRGCNVHRNTICFRPRERRFACRRLREDNDARRLELPEIVFFFVNASSFVMTFAAASSLRLSARAPSRRPAHFGSSGDF
jgi:hypothetical protein